MTLTEHYEEAERLLNGAEESHNPSARLAAAQVHATLALTLATLAVEAIDPALIQAEAGELDEKELHEMPHVVA